MESLVESVKTDGAEIPELVADLRTAKSGISFVYDIIEKLVERYELSDAVMILDHPELGRQAFRAARRPIGEGSGPALNLLECPEGVHGVPGGVDPVAASVAVELCRIALDLDMYRHDSRHDGLTGLYNRRFFDVMFRRCASQSARYGWSFSTVIFDIDSFKQLNDRFGHMLGDRVLQVVGADLHHALRSSDVAGRVGGDEFAILLMRADREKVPAFMARIRHAVEANMEMSVGFSFGIAEAPTESTDPAELYRLADARLMAAKGTKR
jgi:diguanylate cyclase (GGDEF)-like protein